jgi:hypothetical protein
MRYLLMLAAAASLAACHNRAEDDVGAAPDQGDTTAVTATDTTAVPTDSTMGQRPGDTDTTMVQQDTTMQDTTGAAGAIDTTTNPTGNTPTDTLSQPTGDTTGATPSDTSAGAGAYDSTSVGQDTSGMAQPSDSSSNQ